MFVRVVGVGKTLLARALATEFGARFIALPLHALMRAEVGAGERALAAVFARAVRPCVVFIDEVQAVCGAMATQGEAGRRIAAQLLVEFDVAASDGGLLIVGATNGT